MTLYSDLDLPEDASPEDVKRAYRRRARATHPDKGGSAADFQAVQRAYAVLSDQSKREHYDRTGNDSAAPDIRAVAMTTLATLVTQFIEKMQDIKHQDPLAAVRQQIANGKLQGDQQLYQQQQRIAKWKEAQKRLARLEDALRSDGRISASVRFASRSGVLIAHAQDDGTIRLDFPAAPVIEAAVPDDLPDALGIAPDAVYRTGALRDLLVVLADEAAVRKLDPDLTAIGRITRRDDIRGIVPTGPADGGAGYDFVSRFFAPADGIAEDPVTGSAHTALAPYWSARLGRDELTGLQASARTGLVRVALRGERVHLTGRAVTVVDGELLSAP